MVQRRQRNGWYEKMPFPAFMCACVAVRWSAGGWLRATCLSYCLVLQSVMRLTPQIFSLQSLLCPRLCFFCHFWAPSHPPHLRQHRTHWFAEVNGFLTVEHVDEERRGNKETEQEKHHERIGVRSERHLWCGSVSVGEWKLPSCHVKCFRHRSRPALTE